MTPLLTAYLQAWKQYFDFSGQTTRDDFWWFMLAHLLITLVVVSIEIATNNPGWLDSVLQPHQLYPNARHLSSAFA